MTSRRALSAAAKAELDATLDSLTFRALEETAVVVATVAYVSISIARSLLKRKKATR